MNYEDYEDYDNYNYRDYDFVITEPAPVRPSKKEPVSIDTHKEWIKERKALGNKRLDRKTKAMTKRTV